MLWGICHGYPSHSPGAFGRSLLGYSTLRHLGTAPGGSDSFKTRITRSGFDAKVAAENISAGYHTIAEAFSGWRDSPHHRANISTRRTRPLAGSLPPVVRRSLALIIPSGGEANFDRMSHREKTRCH